MDDLIEINVEPEGHLTPRNNALIESVFEHGKRNWSHIQSLLMKIPSFLELIHSSFPETDWELDLPKHLKDKLQSGEMKLFTKKDGTLLAQFKGKRGFGEHIPIKEVNRYPEMASAVNNYLVQRQMANIVELLNNIQEDVCTIIGSIQDDRIALCISAERQLLNARTIKNEAIKHHCYALAIQTAEDSRSQLMLSIKRSLGEVQDQPKHVIGMIMAGDKSDKIKQRLNEVQRGFVYMTRATLLECISFHDLKETDAMILCVTHYADFIQQNLGGNTLLELNSEAGSNMGDYFATSVPQIKGKLDSIVDNLKSANEVLEHKAIDTLFDGSQDNG